MGKGRWGLPDVFPDAGGASPPHPLPSRQRACLVLSLIFLVWNLLSNGPAVVAGIGSPFRTPPPGPAADSPAPTEPADPAVLRKASGGKKAPLTLRQQFLLGYRVDINAASWQEISRLPGVSDDVARAVVARRESAGPFRDPEDLLGVRGIKEKRLRKILPFLRKLDNN